MVGLGGSIANLTVISIDRYLAVFFPLSYYNKLTPRVAIGLIAIAWLVVLAMILSPIVGHHVWNPRKQCDVSNIYHDDYVVFIITLSITLWVVDTTLYCCVVRTAMKQMNKIHKISSIVCGNTHTKKVNTTKLSRRTHKEMKKARMMAIVLGLFIIGYTPYVIFASLKHVYGGETLSLARDVAIACAMCNSCINSVVYGIMNLDFRCAFYQLLRCHRNRVLDANSYLHSPSIGSGPVSVVQCYRPSVYSIRSGNEPTHSGSAHPRPSSSGGQDPVTLPTVD